MTISLDLSELVGNVIVGIVIAVASSWITVQLSLRKFRNEKWWERRVTAYERVIEALHQIRIYVALLYDAAAVGKDLSNPEFEELGVKAKKAQLELFRAIDMGSLFLSAEAHQRLLRFRRDQEKIDEWGEDLLRVMERDLHTTDSCLEDLIRMAKKDLRVG